MIRKFSAQNFLSVRDEQTVSFETKGPESEVCARMKDGACLNKLAIFYGANASGKSNMLIALTTVFKLLAYQEPDSVIGYEPFILTGNEPTVLSMSFYAGGILYDYKVRYVESHIISEDMYYYPNGAKALFYNRRFAGEDRQADMKFGDSLRLSARTRNSIVENTRNHVSVLSVCGKLMLKDDAAPLSGLYNSICGQYHDIDGDRSDDSGLVSLLTEVFSDRKKVRFYNKMLEKADLNISDFHPVTIDNPVYTRFFEELDKRADIPETAKKQMLKDGKLQQLLKPVVESIDFTNHSAAGDFNVPMRLQSKGTMVYLRKLDILYDLITGSHTYLMDELDEDLHYDMLLYYLNVFLFNSGESQLILTSQETALLSEDLLNENRSLVFFAWKDGATASSVYRRADTFGLHRNLSLYSCYKAGRLGAKPELGSIFIDMED